jgi:hypothetical protein
MVGLTPLAPPRFPVVMLQIDAAGHQARDPSPGMKIHDFNDHIRDFEYTAGPVANLDLVISIDTSVAHLVGSMGKPVWLMNLFMRKHRSCCCAFRHGPEGAMAINLRR